MGTEVRVEVPVDARERWQRLLDALALVLEVPAALIMRTTGPHIEVFLSSSSEGNPYRPGDREVMADSGLYCETVLKTQDKLAVPDALADARWRDNPDVKLNMISYLGFPVRWPDDKPFGTICVLDSKPHRHSVGAETVVSGFRDVIESQLAMILVNHLLGDKNRRLTDYLMELQALRGVVGICAHCKSIRDTHGAWHPVEHYLIRHPEADFSHGVCPKCAAELYPAP